MKSAQGYNRSWRLKIFPFLGSGSHLVCWSGMILAILVGSHLGNIPVKFELHWPRDLGEIAFKANYSPFSIFSSNGHFMHQSETVLAILVEGHLSNIFMKFE